MTKPTTILFALLATLALGHGAAHAIQPAEPGPNAAPYVSPDRARCEAELGKDLGWYAELKLQLKDDVHRDEYATFQRNNRHVIIAYAAIWVLTVGFALLMFLRQRALHVELARLKSDLTRAAKDGGV